MKSRLEDRSCLILHDFYKFTGEMQEAGRWGLNKDKNSHIESTNPFADRTSLQGCSQLYSLQEPWEVQR